MLDGSNNMNSCKDVLFWGGSLILLHVFGVKYPKNPNFVGVNGCCDNRKQVQSPKADTKRDRVTVPVTLHDCCVTSKLQD